MSPPEPHNGSIPADLSQTNKDPVLTPAAISKISMVAGLNRKKLQQQSSADARASPGLIPSFTKHAQECLAHEAKNNTHTTLPVHVPKPRTRYTISASIGVPPQPQIISTKTHHNSVATADRYTNGGAYIASAQPSYTRTNHIRKQSHATPGTSISSYQSQPATMTVPPIGEDLKSRLEGLKQFKAWGEKLHETRLEHDEALRKAKNQGHERAAVNHDLPLRHDADLIETYLHAPTPFSSPQVTPVPIIATNPGQQSTCLLCAEPPPVLYLQQKFNDNTTNNRPKSNPRTITISSSSSFAELERRSRSLSISCTNTPSRSRSWQGEKRYPPISFPKNFNERLAEQPQAHAQADEPVRKFDQKLPTPAISPMTKPTIEDETELAADQATLSTPHDNRGRPVFYTTIHYFTECPHACPPANRPLDPNSQPRRDSDFHPTNPAITRSIIPGMCFNCDTFHRRSQEDDVVSTSTGKIAGLTSRLAHLVEQLELIVASSSDEECDTADDRQSARLHTTCSFPEDAHDLRHQLSSSSLPPLSDDPPIPIATRSSKRSTPEQRSYQSRITTQIRKLEAEIEKIQSNQGELVRGIWRGYTRRWGPATLGVQRGAWSRKVEQYHTKEDHEALLEHQRRDIDRRLDMPDEIGHDDDELQVAGFTSDEDDDDVDGGMSTLNLGGSSVCNCEHLLNRDMSRSRTTGRSRDSSQALSATTVRTALSGMSVSTTSHPRDIPSQREPGEGKMRIGWIRE